MDVLSVACPGFLTVPQGGMSAPPVASFGGQSRVCFGNHVSMISITSQVSRQHGEVLLQAALLGTVPLLELSRIVLSR